MTGTGPLRTTFREWLIQGALLLVLLACVFPKTFLSGEITLPGGLLYDGAPWKEYAPADFERTKNVLTVENLMQVSKFYYRGQKLLEGGEWPLWNHLEFAGMPLHANVQSTMFYPPRILHVFFDHYSATTLFILLKLWLAGMTAYLCGRGMGLRVGGSRFFSVGWMLSGYNLAWCYWPPPDVSVWAPLLLLGVEWIAQGKLRKGFWTTALGGTLILLAGHPETSFSFGLGIGLYFLVRLFLARSWGLALGRRFATVLGAWVLALAVCAVMLLPFFEYLPVSHNAATRIFDEAGKHFLPLDGHLSFWMPRFFGTAAESTYWGPAELNSTFFAMLYPGMAVWIVLLFSVVAGPFSSVKRVQFIALSVPCVLSFLFAHNLFFLTPIQELPVLRSMWRVYFVSFGMLALPLMAAMVLDGWTTEKRDARKLKVPVSFLVGAAAYIAVVAGMSLSFRESFHAPSFITLQVLIAVAFGGIGFLIMAWGGLAGRGNMAAVALTLLLAADQVVAVRDLLPTAPREDFFVETELTDFLRGLDPPPRVSVTSGGIRPALMYAYDIEEQWGHDGIYPERIISFYGRLGAHIWNAVEPVASVGYYLRDPSKTTAFPYEDSRRFTRVGTFDGIEVYKNEGALPRAYLVGKIEVFDNVDDLFVRMADRAFDPKRAAVTDAPPGVALPETDRADLGTVSIRHRSATKVALDVTAHDDCVLVLSDAFYPGWTARIDSEEAEIFPVYHAFRGLVVPAGEHSVEFHYYPKSFRTGLMISTCALILGALGALISLLRNRRTSSRV